MVAASPVLRLRSDDNYGWNCFLPSTFSTTLTSVGVLQSRQAKVTMCRGRNKVFTAEYNCFLCRLAGLPLLLSGNSLLRQYFYCTQQQHCHLVVCPFELICSGGMRKLTTIMVGIVSFPRLSHKHSLVCNLSWRLAITTI